MRSWRRDIRLLIAGIFAVLVIFIAAVSWNFSGQLAASRNQNSERELASVSLKLESSMEAVNSELKAFTYGFYDLGIPLASGSGTMSLFDKQEVQEMEQNSLMTGSACALFSVDTETGTIIAETQASFSGFSVFEFRGWTEGADLAGGSYADSRWILTQIGNSSYFVESIDLGKYRIGAVLDPAVLDPEGSLGQNEALLFGQNGSFYFYTEKSSTGEIQKTGGKRYTSLCENSAGLIPADKAKQLQQGNKTMSEVLGDTGIAVILIRNSITFTEILSSVLPFLLAAGILSILMVFLLERYLRRYIAAPTDELLKGIAEIENGNADYRLNENTKSAEFRTVFRNFNSMLNRIRNLRMEQYESELRSKQEQLTLLRAQVRPHFFLNMLNTINSLAGEHRDDDVQHYTIELSKYMRYMLRMQEKTNPLALELQHVQDFLNMQKIRYPDKIDALISCPEALKEIRVPYLILSTIVENSFKHAMNAYDHMLLIIQCEYVKKDDFEGCMITVCDNGGGYPEETLQQFSKDTELPAAKEHFGLTNVRRTMQLTYGRSDLMRLSNSVPHGANTEILIPLTKSETDGLRPLEG